MKKILGLVVSKRILGNGEILLKEAAASTGENCQLELLRLSDLRLDPCRGCYTCIIPGKQCPQGDDLYFLADRIKMADGIILSAPCYLLGPAAVTKLLTDRIIALAQLIDDFWAKPCIVIATAGMEGWEGYTLSALNTISRFMGFDLKDSHMFVGALPGDGILGDGTLDRVKNMGKALFGEARRAQEGECPTCWSQIWKFPYPGEALCPICGQTAKLDCKDNVVRWVFGKSRNIFRKEALKDHFQGWMQAKVEEFISRRQELAEVRNRYKGDYIWLSRQRD